MNDFSLDFSNLGSISETELINRLSRVRVDQNSELNPELLSKIYSESPREAAVLVPFFRNDNFWYILFIHRTDDSREHSGQVAFPGGRLDYPSEPVFQAALRETQEEIGLGSENVKIIGKLPAIYTITNYLVTPVIGIIPWPYSFSIQPLEVKHIFTIPLTWLADPNNHIISNRFFSPLDMNLPVIYFKEYQDELLWGVSARIMLNLLKQLSE